MDNSFFLTPQIANLIEDFVRETRRGSSLYLLYGEEGVGKSRLLKKLAADRLTEQNVHFIDFAADTQTSLGDTVRETAARASREDVIVFDHFDAASNKSQQQIFDSWATDGRDKHLNMIVCANSAGLKRFRQLAQQFQVEAKSFKLQPFDQVMSEAYLQYLLYPDYPFATMVLPAPVKRLLRQSKGFFHRIREIADQHGAAIEIKHEPERASRSMPILITVCLFAGIMAAGYFFHVTISPPAGEPLAIENQVEPSVEPEPVTKPQSALETTSEPAPDPLPEKGPQQQPEQTPGPRIESSTASAPGPLSQADWFNQRLESSRNWARSSDSSRGTIQIMSIEVSRFSDDSFQAYLDRLTGQGLDISQLLIFETELNGRPFYSIMYGDYADRQEAKNRIRLLPEILRTENPIPRSAGGILSGMTVSDDN